MVETDLSGAGGSDKESSMVAHYTSASALVSIIEKGELWASDPRHLNDRVEISHGSNLIRELLNEKASRGEVDAAKVPSLEDDLKSLFSFSIPSVVCFSRSIDSLSQWRGYGSGAVAVALEFGEEALRSRVESQGFRFVECIYDHAQQRRQASQFIDSIVADDRERGGVARWIRNAYTEREDPELLAAFQSLFKLKTGETPSEEVQAILRRSIGKGSWSRLQWEVLPKIAAFKHRSFKHEEELRAVIEVDEGSDNYRFRTTNRTIVPYTSLKIGPDDKKATPLRAIRIGPNVDFEENERAIKLLLTRYLYPKSIQVEKSDSTYRY